MLGMSNRKLFNPAPSCLPLHSPHLCRARLPAALRSSLSGSVQKERTF